MDLLSVLPDFSTKSYSHILPPLERKHISTVDLITLDTLEIAKRAHVPPADVRRLSADVVAALHASLGCLPKKKKKKKKKSDNNDNEEDEGQGEGEDEDEDDARNKLDLSRWDTISTLDATLDELLGGGIPTGYLTEITGESGSGKTQFLLNLLLAAQLAPPRGIGKSAIYISTEAPLSTPRLSQLLQKHPYLSTLPDTEKPSLAKVLSITAVDLETQDHILNYQLPVAISRFNVGLVVIDSITANYRAEHASNSMQALSARSGKLAKLGHMLRNLAASEDVAIVVANQVSDRFDSLDGLQQQSQHQGRVQSGPNRSLPPRNRIVEDTPSSSPATTQSSQLVEDDAFDGGYLIGHPVRNETLTLGYQEKFFTGWGDDVASDYYVSEVQKTPALGLVWSTQIACRIVLKKDDEVDPARAAAAVSLSQPVQPVHSGISTARNISSPLSNSPDTQNENKAAAPREPSLSQPAPSTTSTPTPTPTPTPTTTTTTTTTSAAGAATPDTKRKMKRRMKLVFAPWASGMLRNSVGDKDDNTDEVEFEIWQGGIKSVVRE